MNDHTMRTSETEQRVGLHEPIREMLEGLSLCSPGPEYFSTLVQELARTLDAEFAFAAEIAGEEPLRARTVARVVDNAHVANINTSWTARRAATSFTNISAGFRPAPRRATRSTSGWPS